MMFESDCSKSCIQYYLMKNDFLSDMAYFRIVKTEKIWSP